MPKTVKNKKFWHFYKVQQVLQTLALSRTEPTVQLIGFCSSTLKGPDESSASAASLLFFTRDHAAARVQGHFAMPWHEQEGESDGAKAGARLIESQNTSRTPPALPPGSVFAGNARSALYL